MAPWQSDLGGQLQLSVTTAALATVRDHWAEPSRSLTSAPEHR
jgi:hypothetical protein